MSDQICAGACLNGLDQGVCLEDAGAVPACLQLHLGIPVVELSVYAEYVLGYAPHGLDDRFRGGGAEKPHAHN